MLDTVNEQATKDTFYSVPNYITYGSSWIIGCVGCCTIAVRMIPCHCNKKLLQLFVCCIFVNLLCMKRRCVQLFLVQWWHTTLQFQCHSVATCTSITFTANQYLFLQVFNRKGLKIATDLHLMPRLRMSGALPPLSHMLTLHVRGQLYFIFLISVIFSIYVTVSKIIALSVK
jgi:hypothetical protein